jgi:exonuclease SbcD
MIRILHTSDWHLGRQLFGRSLIEDQTFVLDRLLDLIDSTKPHALFIAGDVFDRSLPPETAVTLLDNFLTEAAAKRGLKVFLIPGNHDSCERLGFASKLLRDRGVTIFATIEDSFSPVKITGEDGAQALVYGIPFVEPIVISRALERRAALANAPLTTPDLAIRALCQALLAEKTEQLPKLLLCHAFVAGGESSESEKEIFIGGSSLVDSNAFAGFAYTALGHLHKPQSAGSPAVRYSGSLLKYSKSEIAHEKGILEVLIRPKGEAKVEISFETHRLPILRQLRFIEAELAELLRAAGEDERRDDYIIASYTDTGAILDARAKLLAVYPNLLNVSRAQKFLPGSAPALAKERERLSELDLFAEFFSASTGSELSADEREVLIGAINELGAEPKFVGQAPNNPEPRA